jgi:hypothetical protein
MSPDEARVIQDVFARVRQMGSVRDDAARVAIEREVARDPEVLVGLVRAIVALDQERDQLLGDLHFLEEKVEALERSARDNPSSKPRGGLFDSTSPWGQGRQPGLGDTGLGGSLGNTDHDRTGRGPWESQRNDQGARGGFLRTAAGAAMGMAGGLFAYEALKGLFGGDHSGGHVGASPEFSGPAETVESVQGFELPFDVSNSGFSTGGSMDDVDAGFFDAGDDSAFS